MAIPPEIDANLLERYLSGACTSEERARVDAWATAHPDARAELDMLRGVRARAAGRLRHFDSEAGWRRMMSRHAPRRSFIRDRPAIDRQIIPIAAALLVTTTAGVLAWRMVAHTGGQPFREFVTASGGRATVTLRDGTRVILGPATQLRIPADFGAATRTVELSGEALFAVVRDPRHPFTVRTRRATTRDVGTVFIVRAYTGDAADRIAVTEGRVALGATVMSAGDLATVTDSGSVVAHHARLEPLTAWTQGGLAFERTPLREVARELGRTFGVEVTVADSALAEQHITATFSNQPLDVMLDAVTGAIGARYEHTPHGIVIRRAHPRSLQTTVVN